MINLTIKKNNYIQFGGEVKQRDVVSENTQMCMFSSPSTSLWLLVGAFDPLTFKVIINMYDLITIFLIVLGLSFVDLFLVSCFLPREVPFAFVVKLIWCY